MFSRLLGDLLNVSAGTGRRRLAELEAAGLVRVTQRNGGWLSLVVILAPDQAAQAAASFAQHGRQRAGSRRDPYQIPALTPDRNRDAPLADSGTPQEAPLTYAPTEEAPPLPAVGAHIKQGGSAAKAPPARRPRSRPRGKTQPPRHAVLSAAQVYRALPVELTRAIPEHGSRRVLAALAIELQHRTPAELTRRIARNWEHWKWRTLAGEPIRDAVAVSIRISRRGLQCPDVRCEDGHQLDLDAPCKACALLAEAHLADRARTADQATPGDHVPPIADHNPTAAHSSGTSARLGRQRQHPPEPAPAKAAPVDNQRHAALARHLLRVRDPVEREALIAAHQAQSRSA